MKQQSREREQSFTQLIRTSRDVRLASGIDLKVLPACVHDIASILVLVTQSWQEVGSLSATISKILRTKFGVSIRFLEISLQKSQAVYDVRQAVFIETRDPTHSSFLSHFTNSIGVGEAKSAGGTHFY